MKRKARIWAGRRRELFLLIGGAAFLATFLGINLWASLAGAEDIQTFNARKGHVATPAAKDGGIEERDLDTASSPGARALLRIQRVDMEVAVYAGTGDADLLRGAGFIEGTARPGATGNVGIAAHRDRHFRPLQNVRIGDEIQLETVADVYSYQVTNLSVVDPTDIQVLDNTSEAVLTLVTCFPFYFVGNAPKRFIVRAVAVDTNIANQGSFQ